MALSVVGHTPAMKSGRELERGAHRHAFSHCAAYTRGSTRASGENDAMDVRLLRCAPNRRVLVAVDDHQTGEAFSVEVREAERHTRRSSIRPSKRDREGHG